MTKHDLGVLIRFHIRERGELLNIPAEQRNIKYHNVRIAEYKDQLNKLEIVYV
jgi:hypothetical protein